MENDYEVIIENIGGKPMPVDLTIFYEDGTQQLLHRDPSCWEQNKQTAFMFSSTKKPTRLKLGSLHIPDVNKKDNEYVFGAPC